MATERFELRLDTETLDRIDAWRANQLGLPSRAGAVRQLIDVGLSVSSGNQSEVTFSDGEKLIQIMLIDLYGHLGVDMSDIDPEFVSEAIGGGHYWAFKEKYPFSFHNHVTSRQIVAEARDVLDMWSFIEEGYAKLSEKDKERVALEGGAYGEHVQFRGFDENWETEYYGMVRFLTDVMGQFTDFKGRRLHTVGPNMPAYRRMLAVFEPIRPTLVGIRLSASQIIGLLMAEINEQKAT